MTSTENAAIVVAHPGHEVRVHGWLERARPLVFVLTDGAGRAGQRRIRATGDYLNRFSFKPGCVFGRFTDTEVYSAVLARDFDKFLRLSEELAEAFVASNVTRVAGDASEGYNTTHDIARLVTNAAVSMASRATAKQIANYDFPVVQRPDHCYEHARESSIWLRLDDETFTRKLAAAREFYPELFREVSDAAHERGENTLRDFLEQADAPHAATTLEGLDVFRVECLRPAADGDDARFESVKPFYETHGERRVAAGHYERVIRFGEHIRPLADALRENAWRRV